MSFEQERLSRFGEYESTEDVPLPEEMISDVLSDIDDCADYAADVLDSLEDFEQIRNELSDQIKTIGAGPTYDSIAGVDGSYTAIEGSGMSIGMCSAVRAGDEFGYQKEVFPTPDTQDITQACRGIGTMLEMKAVCDSTEDMVIFDGSFISALTNMNELLGRINESPHQALWDVIEPALDRHFLGSNYPLKALREKRVVASPKRSTSTYFLENHFPEYVDRFSDRSFFSMALKSGEYLHFNKVEEDVNFGRKSDYFYREDGEALEKFFENSGYIVGFYKPEPWSRAFRLEVPRTRNVEDNYKKIIRTFGEQIIDPSMLEPYQQWLADTLCKKIVEVSNLMKEGIQNKLSDEGYDSEQVNQLLRGYRTEVM